MNSAPAATQDTGDREAGDAGTNQPVSPATTITLATSPRTGGQDERADAARYIFAAASRMVSAEGRTAITELAGRIARGDHATRIAFRSADMERAAIVAHILGSADRLGDAGRTSFYRLAAAIAHGRHNPPEGTSQCPEENPTPSTSRSAA